MNTTQQHTGEYLQLSAEISECSTYRYTLTRRWAVSGQRVCFVMLNPSTADGLSDDRTIRKCVGFAKRFEGGELTVVNLYAFRSTDPTVMFRAQKGGTDITGWKNNMHIHEAINRADLTIVAWGSDARIDRSRVDLVRSFQTVRRLHCLRLTQDGSPGHPLYLSGQSPLLVWR